MKVHLLHQAADFDVDAGLSPGHEDLTSDLELATLLEAMAGGDSFIFDVCRKVLLACLQEPAAIGYRQRVLADCLAQPAVIREMYSVAVGALQDKRQLWGGYGGTYQNPSSNLSGAVSTLETYVARLRQLRQIAGEHAEKFRSDGLTTLFGTLRRELDDAYFAEVGEHLRQLRFRDGVLISAGLGEDNSGTGFVLRRGDGRPGWKERLGIGPRTVYSFTIAPRDEAGAQILEDLTGRGINLVANAAAQSADHIGSYFTMLRAELAFYVGCVNLSDRLAAKEVPISFPDAEPAGPPPVFGCADLRDACLALQSAEAVVGNDVQTGGKPLIVITGANSGGKSTFLRSVGLAQLMMQCGLFVTARSYRANVARGIFTHFIRAEDPGMTSGRLDDELRRMSVIADRIGPHGLMLFNESFAGTNEREGAEIGYQIVRALLDVQIRVLFVTHRFGLAERFHRQHADQALFLRAEREPDGRRTFRLAVKEPLPTSFGEDLYYRLGGWLDEDKDACGRRGRRTE
jgi:hypothetical protein